MDKLKFLLTTFRGALALLLVFLFTLFVNSHCFAGADDTQQTYSKNILQANPNPHHAAQAESITPAPLVLLFGLFIPVYFSLAYMSQPFTRLDSIIEEELIELQAFVDQAEEEAEVLFITQRQLLTFQTIETETYVDDYEKMILMEMAMADNPFYLGQFEQDLAEQRFSLIVTDKLSKKMKDPSIEALGEENNVYVENVVKPLMCYYQVNEWLRGIAIELWTPKAKNTCEIP